MKLPTRNGGFTLVELQAGMLAAALVVLSCGMLLYVSLASWHSSCADIELRRDASAAAELLAHALRGAAFSNVTWAAGTHKLSIRQRDDTRSQFWGRNNALLYRPDSRLSDVPVIQGRLAAFNAVVTNDGFVVVYLRLTNANTAAEFTTTFKCRNQP